MFLKKVLQKGILFILAAALITMIMHLILLFTPVKEYQLIINQLILWCVIGSLYVQLPMIAKTDDWNLAAEVFVGFILSSFEVFSGYTTFGNGNVKSVHFIVLSINFILIYAAICLFRYLNLIHEIKKINEKLSQR